MTTVDMSVKPPGLSFKITFGAAFRSVFGQLGQFVRAAAVPLLLSIAILLLDFSLRALAFTGTLPLDPEGWPATVLVLVTSLLALLPFSLLGIAVTRMSYLGPQPGLLPARVLGRRTFVYAGYLLLLLVALILMMAISFFAGIAVVQATNLGETIAGPLLAALGGFAGFGLLFYLLLRFSLVLPAVALDEKLGLGGSWRLTRRGSFKLLGVFLLLILVLLLAMAAGSIVGGSGSIRLGTAKMVVPEDAGAGTDWLAIVLANMPTNLWNLVANFLIFAMGCGALTSAYSQLSGWGGPREEILERFE